MKKTSSNFDHQDWVPVTLEKYKKPVVTGRQKAAVAHAKHITKLEDEDYVPDRPVTSYGKFIQNIRLTHKLNQKELAAKLGVPAKTVKLWESGKEIIPSNKISAVNRLFKVNVKRGTIIVS